MEDGAIVDLFLRRDEAAIAQTSEKYGARLRQLAFGITQDRSCAEECENDAYLQAWNSIPPHEPRTYLYAFLARITRHIALNCCRDRGRLKRSAFLCELNEELTPCLPAMPGPEQSLALAQLGEDISRFLHTLSREQRLLFVRRYWYMDSIAELAARLDISSGKVKTSLHRSRLALRAYLEKEGYQL